MIQLESICAQVGLRFVLLPEFKDTHLSGAAFWIQSTPIITLSLRYKRNDHFWFSFFHEVGHILRHGKKGIYLDSFLSEGKIDSLKEEEQEANQFAANHLISESKWEEVKLINPISEQSIKGFAKKIEIHPGIIVGRLQREGLIPYNKLNDLKEKWDLVDSKIEI
jgi:Zn-dependent peptidase ImmA (M78 family)